MDYATSDSRIKLFRMKDLWRNFCRKRFVLRLLRRKIRGYKSVKQASDSEMRVSFFALFSEKL